jgi:hypothetical protein
MVHRDGLQKWAIQAHPVSHIGIPVRELPRVIGRRGLPHTNFPTGAALVQNTSGILDRGDL